MRKQVIFWAARSIHALKTNEQTVKLHFLRKLKNLSGTLDTYSNGSCKETQDFPQETVLGASSSIEQTQQKALSFLLLHLRKPNDNTETNPEQYRERKESCQWMRDQNKMWNMERLESCVWMRKNGQSNRCRKGFQCRRGSVSMVETTDASDRLGGCLREQEAARRLNRGINWERI